MFRLAVCLLALKGVTAPLPSGCRPLNEQTFSTLDPATIYPANSELQGIVPPSRTGSLRSQGALPTQHFATNEIKPGAAPMRLIPYSAKMTNEGITYDAYTLDRWNATSRTDTMQQQTPSRVGAPWDKVLSVGTNMKQLVSGPDGNPTGIFTGRSGIQVGILQSGEPVWESFGDNFANFRFSDTGSGSMEAVLVRGSALLTHRFTNANPLLVPYCLSSINGVSATYSCPVERDAADPGSGFLDGTCSGGMMTIIVRTTKHVELSSVQYAVNTAADWPNSHSMTTCSNECVLSNEGKRVDITVNGASGTMNYAVNIIGHYVIPPDWVNNPNQVTCSGRRAVPPAVRVKRHATSFACDGDFCHTPQCDIQGSDNTFTLTLDFQTPVSGLDVFQFAVNTASQWDQYHPMITCTDQLCTITADRKQIVYRNTFPVENTMKYAINMIGVAVKPPQNWQTSPYEHVCGSGPSSTAPPTAATVGPTASPSFCTDPVTLGPCSSSFCKTTFCADAGSGQQYFKLVMQLDSPITGIDQVQVAMNHGDDWESSHPMITCTTDTCSLSGDKKTVTYCNTVKQGIVKYAVNIIGRFIQPPENWQTQPFQSQCGGGGSEIATGTKFVIELNEPGGALPGNSRKWVAYFSETMRAVMDASGVHFVSTQGGLFTGLMQLGYVGAGQRGDSSKTSFLDAYAGVFSYKPDVSFCAQGGKGFISFDWNKHNKDGPTADGQLLMVALPHHEMLLNGLIDTPFGYRGYAGDDWLMEEPLPEAEMEPDRDGVNRIRADFDKNRDLLEAIERDATEQAMANTCTLSNSYGVGKEISMVARLASISRAFQTNHYQQLDSEIKACLEKWLRIDDTLSDGNKFRYDTVYGGLLLRSVPAGQPIDPNANFGFPVFSDHHFHLGYFVYALAYYARNYPTWAQAHRERILLIVRDLSNPSRRDVYFPVVRHKDFYMGHSWATGLVGGHRQAESSTEAIACYHGVAALGDALGDDDMREVGQIMLATEIRSVRHYYHVRSYNRHLFPPILQGYGAIGQFAEESIFLYTLNWPCDPHEFPMRHACLVGIQVIPITSIAKYYQDQEWAGAVRNVCGWAVNPQSAPGAELIDPDILRPVSTGWGAFCHSVTAKYDTAAQQAAANYVRGLGPKRLVGGTGEASTLLFIYEST